MPELKLLKINPPSSLKRNWNNYWKQVFICQIFKIHFWLKWEFTRETNVYEAGTNEENSYPIYRKRFYERKCFLCGKVEMEVKRT